MIPRPSTAGEAAVNMLECSLGAYSAGVLCDWEAPVGVDWDAAAGRLLANPNVWTDCSLVLDEVSGAASTGSGVYASLHVDARGHRGWGILISLVLLWKVWLHPVGVHALVQVPRRLFRGLSFGGCSCFAGF